MLFEIIGHVETIEFNTVDGLFRRTHDLFSNRLVWWNEYKQYEYKNKTWQFFTKRKGYVKTVEKCWVEEEYKKYMRKNKLKSIIE